MSPVWPAQREAHMPTKRRSDATEYRRIAGPKRESCTMLHQGGQPGKPPCRLCWRSLSGEDRALTSSGKSHQRCTSPAARCSLCRHWPSMYEPCFCDVLLLRTSHAALKVQSSSSLSIAPKPLLCRTMTLYQTGSNLRNARRQGSHPPPFLLKWRCSVHVSMDCTVCDAPRASMAAEVASVCWARRTPAGWQDHCLGEGIAYMLHALPKDAMSGRR